MEKGKDPDAVMAAFSSDTKGAREVNASDPIDDTSIKVGALLPDTEYVARLVATNRNGTVEGAVAGPFQTLGRYCWMGGGGGRGEGKLRAASQSSAPNPKLHCRVLSRDWTG